MIVFRSPKALKSTCCPCRYPVPNSFQTNVIGKNQELREQKDNYVVLMSFSLS